jgi:N-glycosylase/DNA lyase
LPKEIKDRFSPNIIMIVQKLLYRIPKAGTHWWATYHKHYREKLVIAMFTYDPCLLIITTKAAFGVVGI